MHQIAVLDAARDYLRIGLARLLAPEHANLFLGEKGQRLEHVSPHAFSCDRDGLIANLALSGAAPDEVGILVEGPGDFRSLFKHLRRFLTVVRQRDRRRVLFRYYDPRVLRAFLPVCTRDELDQFFGPIEVFHCQADEPGRVFSYSRNSDGFLSVSERSFDDWFFSAFGVRPSTVPPIPPMAGMPPQEEPLHIKLFRRMQIRALSRTSALDPD